MLLWNFRDVFQCFICFMALIRILILGVAARILKNRYKEKNYFVVK